ncbi:MAG TPA: hypothetical protein VGQ83_05840 [Polyangia bacterium]|jgi:hypothetical protein
MNHIRRRVRWVIAGSCAVVLTSTLSVVLARNVDTVSWQKSVAVSIELGVRDKEGQLGSYEARFVAEGPKKTLREATTRVQGDAWGSVTFPKDFKPEGYLPDGKYTWKCVVKGKVVTKGHFAFSGD